MQNLRIVFVMDRPHGIDISADTTFALALEAQRRGHALFYANPALVGSEGGDPVAVIQEMRVSREEKPYVFIGEEKRVKLDVSSDVVWQRKDPPVDADYIYPTQILALCRRSLVLNRPSGILAANEKLYTLNFPDLMPDTIVSSSSEEILRFLDDLGGTMVIKPLDGRGGEGIFVLRRGDVNLFSLIEQATNFGERLAMAQEYLPAIRQGDKRILLIDGEPLGAVLRVPASGESRANLHVGGSAAAGILDDSDKRIIRAIGPRLRKDGLFLVGIDVIGGKLTEINVTSPTGIQEMSRIDGVNYSSSVIEAVEAKK